MRQEKSKSNEMRSNIIIAKLYQMETDISTQFEDRDIPVTLADERATSAACSPTPWAVYSGAIPLMWTVSLTPAGTGTMQIPHVYPRQGQHPAHHRRGIF